MGINRKLERWKASELLTQQQVEEILVFEKEHGSKLLFRGLLWIGSFTIIIGILAVIASNWQLIPPYTKVMVHLVINAGLAVCIYIADKHEKTLLKEFLLVGLWGLTLTLIGLTGQVFHLNGSIYEALLLWSLLTTPVMVAYGQTKVSLLPALASFIAGIASFLIEFVFSELDGDQVGVILVGVYSFLPMMFILGARYLDKFERSLVQKMLTVTGIIAIVAGANMACQLWYVDGEFDDFIYHMLSLVILGLATFGANFITVQSGIKIAEYQQSVKMLLVGSLAVSAFSFMFLEVESSIMAAVTFVAYWIFLGYVFNRMNMHGLVSLSLVMAAGRIYGVYLEVFGSLLQTGFGLILSGVLLVGMALGVRKLGKTIRTTQIAGGFHD